MGKKYPIWDTNDFIWGTIDFFGGTNDFIWGQMILFGEKRSFLGNEILLIPGTKSQTLFYGI